MFDSSVQAVGLGVDFVFPRMVIHQQEVFYRLGIWHLDLTHKTNTRWQLPWMGPYQPTNNRMVNNYPQEGYHFSQDVQLDFWP